MSANIDKAYWLGRWDRNETGWHQAEVEPNLINEFGELKATRVLVPLCGKSLDLIWLLSKGHEVIGVEMSPLACRAFFSENAIPFEKSVEDKFDVYRGKRITIYNGDVFDLTSRTLGPIGAIYDRAALIAMPEETRIKYVSHMIQLLRACAKKGDFDFLQIVLERVPSTLSGPPFSVSLSEMKKLYGDVCKAELVSRERLEEGVNNDHESIIFESVYRLQLLDK